MSVVGAERKRQILLWKSYSESQSPKIYRILESKHVLKVAIGGHHTLFLTNEYELYAVGANNYRQLGIERCEMAPDPVLVTPLLSMGIRGISCGRNHSAALTNQGELICWGNSDFGQCGTKVFDRDSVTPTPVSFSDPGLMCTKCKTLVVKNEETRIVDVACGDGHTIALADDSKLWGWGNSPQNGLRCRSSFPQVIEELLGAKVISIAVGANHSAAVCEKVRASALSSQTSLSASNANLSESMKSSGAISSHTSPSRTSSTVSESGLNYSRISAPCPSCNHNMLALNSSSVLDDCHDDNVFSLGASGMLVLDSPEHNSPEHIPRRPSEGNGEKSRGFRVSSSDEEVGFTSTNENYFGVDDDEQTFKSALSFNLEPESVKKFLDKGSVLDVNAHWKYLSPKPDEKHRSRSTLNAECRDRAKLMVQDIANRFDSRSSDTEKEEKQDELEKENAACGPNTRHNEGRATRASMRRRKLTNPLQKTASIAQDTAEFLSNTGSSLIRVKDRMSSLTRRSTFLKRASIGSIGDEDGPGFGGGSGSKHPGSYQRSTGKSTEVFTWGENDHYQLGVGDNKPRSAPRVIKALGHRNALKVCLGRKHSVVLTSNFQIIGFGSNEFGQLGHTSGSANFLPNPDLLKDESGKNLTGWDIAAGNNCTVLVADTGVTRKTPPSSSTFYVESMNSGFFEINPWDPQILYLGILTPTPELPNPIVAVVVNDTFESERISLGASSAPATSNIPLESSESAECTKTLKPYNWPLSNQLSPIEVWGGASDQTLVCRVSQQQRKVLRILLKWAFAERNFFAHMRAIRDLIMKPFLTSDVFRSAVQPSFYGPSVTTLLNSFCDTVDQLGKICVLLIEDVQCECKLSDFLFVRDYQSYIDMFNKFLSLFCDAHCIGSYEFCALSVAVSFFEKNKKCLCDLVGPGNSSGAGGAKEKEAPLHQLFYRLLERPITRISFYKEMLTKLADCLDSFVNEYTTVTKARDEWSNLWEYALEQRKQAEATRLYWDNTSIKISESLKHPKRRLIRDSKKSGLSLLGSNRFATHHFTLFSDMLVHQQFSNHEVFWLQTIWLESLKDGEASKKNCMKLTMPEEREFYLCAFSASDKADWCIDLTKAIERALNPGSVPNIACEAQLDKTLSLCRTSKVREASHTFTSANSKLKGATYKGTWKNGKPHDKGMLVWPDGRTYVGDFSEGLQHGQGRLIVHSPPNGSDSSLQPLFEQSYEGQWQNGHMHGFGMLNYHTGDQYVGEFERSMRCGFGLLRIANPADGSHQGYRKRSITAAPFMHKQSDLSASYSRPYHKSSDPSHYIYNSSATQQASRPLSLVASPTTPDNEFVGFNDFYQRQDSCRSNKLSTNRPSSENLDRISENFVWRRKHESGSVASSEHGSYSSAACAAGEQYWEDKVDSDGVASNLTTDYLAAATTSQSSNDLRKVLRDSATFTHLHLSSDFLEGFLFVGTNSVFQRIFYGEWIDDKRHGYGVLEDMVSGQRYIGMWLNDMKHGNGVTVCSQTGLYYEGTFVNGKLTGTGLLLTEDDTMYEGEMNGYALNGKGILTLPHGDHIEGSFEGSWGAEDLKIRGVLKRYQSEPKTKPCGSLYRKFDVDASLKWEAIFRKCRRKMGVIRSMETKNDGLIALCDKTWNTIANYMEQDTDILKDISNILPLANQSWHILSERDKIDIKDFLQRICWNKNHPIGQLLDELNVVFKATYGGDLHCMHKLLLPHALSELKSLITRFSQTLSYILPCVDPCLTDQHIQRPINDDSYDSQVHCEKVTADLIHPLVFDGMYCSIFSLYALSNDRQDQKFGTSIKLLNQRSDFALMNFYDVEPMFNPPPDPNQEISGCVYEAAIEALKQISLEKVPSRKMECVTRAFSSMIKTASKVADKPEYKMMMDSALPLLMFIIIRAATPYLSAELQFIEDFVEFSAHPEHEFVLHAVKAAFLFIISENP